MQTHRAWIVNANGSPLAELPVVASASGRHPVVQDDRGQFYLVGQANDGPGLGAVAAILGVIGGVLIVSFAIESIPGAMIAHYGYGLPWGKSIGIGVASAVAWNMISGLLRGPSDPPIGAIAPAQLTPVQPAAAAPATPPAPWFGHAPTPGARNWFGPVPAH